MVLLPKVISRLPLIVPRTAIIITTKVLVLIPPPVDAEEAPINIKNIEIINKGFDSSAIFMVLKPEVRVLTDWKNEVANFPIGELICFKC